MVLEEQNVTLRLSMQIINNANEFNEE